MHIPGTFDTDEAFGKVAFAGIWLNYAAFRSARFGRGWDRTSDLPRVNGAQMGTGGD